MRYKCVAISVHIHGFNMLPYLSGEVDLTWGFRPSYFLTSLV
jgi:hypothetical protein